MLSTLLLVILVLLLVGALPNWGYTTGYGPSGALGVVVIIILVLVLLGRI